MKDIVVLGAGGQVGSALCALLGERALPASQEVVDLSSDDLGMQLDALVGGRKITALINAAAYTLVDKAEDEGREANRKLNAVAPAVLAKWCKERGAAFVHYSTDYVFDGSGSAPRNEEEKPHPLNEYGRAKEAGERAIAAIGGQYLIFRTSWVYDGKGRNFLTTMLRLMAEREELSVVVDQIGAPTYAPHLAKATLQALEKLLGGAPGGLYHLCGAGEVSWHGFASSILALASGRGFALKCRHIKPIPSSDYPVPAKRPHNSRLDCSRAERLLGAALPAWEDSLKEAIEEYDAGR